MVKGEIAINEQWCKGCGLCIEFCARKCIVMGDKVGPVGYLLPVFTNPDRCTACGICVWMCPDLAIEVYKYVEDM